METASIQIRMYLQGFRVQAPLYDFTVLLVGHARYYPMHCKNHETAVLYCIRLASAPGYVRTVR